MGRVCCGVMCIVETLHAARADWPSCRMSHLLASWSARCLDDRRRYGKWGMLTGQR